MSSIKDWNDFNLIAPLYVVLIKYNYTLKQIHFLLFKTNRLNNSKLGNARYNVLKPFKDLWHNDRDAWLRFEKWIEEVM